jgi:hypothetical protein
MGFLLLAGSPGSQTGPMDQHLQLQSFDCDDPELVANYQPPECCAPIAEAVGAPSMQQVAVLQQREYSEVSGISYKLFFSNLESLCRVWNHEKLTTAHPLHMSSECQPTTAAGPTTLATSESMT